MKVLAEFSICLLFMFSWSATANGGDHDNLLSFKRIAQVVPSPDGKQVVFVTYQVKSFAAIKNWQYSLHLKNEKGEIQTLAQGDKISSVKWLPDSKRFSYLAKGDQFQSIWVMDSLLKKRKKLFEFGVDIRSFKWSPDGKYIAFTADKEKQKRIVPAPLDISHSFTMRHLYVVLVREKNMTANPINSTDCSISEFSNNPGFDWAPDSQSIAFGSQLQPGLNEYYLKNKITTINLKSHEEKVIPYTEDHLSTQPFYSPDGQWIAFQSKITSEKTSNRSDEIKWNKLSGPLETSLQSFKICVTNVQTFKTHCLSNTPNDNPRIIGWTAATNHVLVWDEFKTIGLQIYALNLDPAIPAIDISRVESYIEPLTISLNNSHTTLGFGYETVEDAPQAFVSPVETFKLEQVGQKTPSQPLGKTQTINWQSKDKTDLEGLLITPPNYDPSKKYPLLVTIHGGPAGVWDKRFLGGCEEYEPEMIDPSGCWSTFLDLGFVVFAPNPRGSTGYGLEFRLANFSDFGGKDYQDIMGGIDQLIQKGIADPKHLAVIGWSYGGYLTTWAIGHSNRFKAAIEGVGLTNLISFSGTSSLLLYTPAFLQKPFWENQDLYLERSPIFYVKNIATPLLIIHGENDPRVPQTQSYEFYNALKQQHKPVKMLLLPGQDHVPNDPNIIYAVINEIKEWLKQAL